MDPPNFEHKCESFSIRQEIILGKRNAESKQKRMKKTDINKDHVYDKQDQLNFHFYNWHLNLIIINLYFFGKFFIWSEVCL